MPTERLSRREEVLQTATEIMELASMTMASLLAENGRYRVALEKIALQGDNPQQIARKALADA